MTLVWCIALARTYDRGRANHADREDASDRGSLVDMKPNSTILSLALILSVLKCQGRRTEQSSDTYGGEVDLGSDEFLGKWLGNVSEVELRAEWSTWKALHRKKYSTSVQNLERYVVWRSNKAYINYHNSFADNFGFYLSMNKFGDLVRLVDTVYVATVSTA